MSSDRKITLHEMYLKYVQRYAKEHDTSVKAVLEGLIDQYIVPELVKAGIGSSDWGELQIAATRLLPSDWQLDPSFNAAASPSDPVRLLHMLTIGEAEPVFVSSDALHVFGKNLEAIASMGGSMTLYSALKLGAPGIVAKRRGNGLTFHTYNNIKGAPVASFPSRHVDKLVLAFGLAIKSQEAKRKTYYAA